MHYLPLVRYVAGRLASPLVEQADLESYGIFGLLEAIDRFDPARGNRFETYAVPRIRGAILDGLRQETWAPALRQKARQLQAALSSLETALGRAPTDAELAAAVGITPKELQRWEEQLAAIFVVSLDEPVPWVGEGDVVSLVETLPDQQAAEPGREAERAERRRVVAEALLTLTEKERLVVTLYYYEGLTTREVAQVLGLSGARISQLHTRAILRLRGRLSRRKAMLVP